MASPRIIADIQLAKLAFTEASRISGSALASDMVEDARYYITHGFDLLKTTGTRDPRVYAREFANDAVVAYAKARLLGVPVATTEFPLLAQRWMHWAAIDNWQQDEDAAEEEA